MQELRLVRYYYSRNREQFTLPEDVYNHWVILSAQTGSFAFTIDGSGLDQEDTAEFGELVFCPPGWILRRRALRPFSFHFIEFAGEFDFAAGKIRLHDFGRLHSTYRYLQSWHAEEQESGRDRKGAEHLVGDLLFMAERERTVRHFPARAAKKDELIVQAASYIQEQACSGQLSMQQLAVKVGLSPSQLTRRFQAAFGISPIRYVTSIRLAKARVLLEETDDTLDQIAVQCGYLNGFYLSRVFEKQMKQSPSVYRRTHRV